jgi:hypothetical protein
MIKKLQLLIFAGMTFAISTFAQPVLTKAGLGFAIGDVYTIGYNSAILDPGAAGANATWDFSKISSTSTATIKGVAPSTLSNGPSFPNSNVALTSSQGSEYYAVTTSLWERQGVEAGTVLIKYSNAETFLTFPLSYNTSSIDSFVGNYKNQGN